MTRALPWLLLSVSLLGCPSSGGPTFKESVKEAYRPCNAEFLKARAGLHAMQLVFKPCGSNNFQNFSWNPEGITLYYRTLQGPWVLKDTGENHPLRLGMPSEPPAWFNGAMLAVPDSTGRKMSVYNIESHVLNLLELDQYDPEQLSRGQEPDEVLFLASETPGGIKYAWRLSANTAEAERAFGWMDTGLETMTYQADNDAVCYREFADTEVVCAQASDGKVIGRMPDRLRGTMSVDGRYVVADYKTNRISDNAAFTQAEMIGEMERHGYPLQAVLYLVALRRYLTFRLPEVDVDDCIGGAAYLFVRGMTPTSTPVAVGDQVPGVMWWTPPPTVIAQLDAEIAPEVRRGR